MYYLESSTFAHSTSIMLSSTFIFTKYIWTSKYITIQQVIERVKKIVDDKNEEIYEPILTVIQLEKSMS